ncbi:hypothetical protein BH11PLA1_BH11PLA1_21530 [soil metagenome]
MNRHPSASSPRIAQASRLLGLDLLALAARSAPNTPSARRAAAVAATLAAARTLADLIASTNAPRAIVLLVGPSGSGKSTIFRALRLALRQRHLAVITPAPARTLAPHAHRRAADLAPFLPVAAWLRLLSAVGLAEAGLLGARLADFSEGQAHRLALALALARAAYTPPARPHHAAPRIWIALDEFTSVLDRATARSLAAGLARAARSESIAPNLAGLLLATAHADLEDPLTPDLAVHTRYLGAPRIFTRPEAAP